MRTQTIPDENIPRDFPDYDHLAHLQERFQTWPHCQVSVMVGAGLSLNSKPRPGIRSHFPTWHELSCAMFNEIYPLPPDPSDELIQKRANEFRQSNALRIASKFEVKYCREKLNSFLLEQIPDNDYDPGEIHKLLLDLPWKDVFTTNYDTLLERPGASERSYRTARDKIELANATPPRIIKLHGSFHSDAYPIITEDDYRTYENCFDHFVISIKDSLIQNAFVLVGFSGDDPNFLNWNGWILDVFGDERNPAYLVGPLSLDEMDRSFYRSRGITPIDLSPIFEGQSPAGGIHAAALDWFLRNLHQMKPQRPERWLTRGFGKQGVSGGSQDAEPETVESLVGSQSTFDEITAIKIIERWQFERRQYPGWLIPTAEHRASLWRTTMSRIPNLMEAAQNWSYVDQVLLYREIVWRVETSLIPLDTSLVEPLENAIDGLFPSLNSNFRLQPSDKAAKLLSVSDAEVQVSWLEVAFALLRDSRESFEEERWSRLREKISSVVDRYPLYDDRFCYEQALWLLWKLQHDQARSLLANWSPSQNSPLAMMWKAGILVELDDQENARTLLRDALQITRQQNNQPPYNNIEQLSLEGWCTYLLMPIESTLALYNLINNSQGHSDDIDINDLRAVFLERWDELKEWDCDPWTHIDYFSKTLSADAPTAKRNSEVMPDFDLDRYVVERPLFEGPNTKWLPAFSYVRMLETVGIPLKYSGDPLRDAAEWLNPFVDFLSPMLLVRAGNVKALRKCNFMSRPHIASMNARLARGLNNWAMTALNVEPLFAVNPPFIQTNQELLLETLVEFLSRLALKLEIPDLESAFRAALTFHNLQEVKTHTSLNKSSAPWFKRLFNASSDHLLLEWLPDLIRFPLPSEKDIEHLQHPSISWPDPMVDFPSYRIHAGQVIDDNLESRIHQAIDWLLRNAQSSSAEIRRRALIRLVLTFHPNLMTREQEKMFGILLWEHTSDDGLPDLPNQVLYNLLLLPAPAEVDRKAKLKQHLLALKPRKSVTLKESSISIDLPGEIEDIMISEISYASKPIVQLPWEPSGEIEWDLAEIDQLWKDVYEWWENDKHAIRHVNNNPGHTYGFEEFARLSMERISMFLSRVVLPQMETANEEEWDKTLSFLSETRQDNVFLTPALPYILLHRPSEHDMVLRNIHSDLSSDDEKAVSAAAEAVSHWAFLGDATDERPVPSGAINDLIYRVVFRRPERIDSCLKHLTIIINNEPDLFNADQVNLVVSSLTPWLEATRIPIPEKDSGDFPEHDRPLLRALLGQLASALSGWLEKKRSESSERPEICALRKSFSSDPLPEVRRSFGNS